MERHSLTQNDIKIMAVMYDVDTGLGLSKAKGITKDEIAERIDFLSESKVYSTIRALLEEGYVEEGIKIGKKKTYHITESGFDFITTIKQQTVCIKDVENSE